jgi:hypothetical protein
MSMANMKAETRLGLGFGGVITLMINISVNFLTPRGELQ